mgnify:CR=1 FL=1
MKIIAVDPGKKAGWCVGNPMGESLWTSGVCSGDDPDECSRTAHEHFITNVHNPSDTHVLIEDQYFMPRGLKGAKTLIRRGAIWWVLARAQLGVPEKQIHWISPSSWQAFFRVNGDKEMIRKLACSVTKRSDVEENEADAICMAYYYAHKGVE